MNNFFKDLDFPPDFLYQMLSLIVSFILIHSIYLLFIEPAAAAQALEAIRLNKAPERTLSIILRDFEQETCLILMFWALSIIFIKWKRVSEDLEIIRENDFLSSEQEIDANTAIQIKEEIASREDLGILSKVYSTVLSSFLRNKALDSVAEAMNYTCEKEGERMESELSMIRYLIWAIPSIGFIGTVRGIGEALSQAHIAVEGNIAGMTASLGVAFNSTFVALVVSIFLMYFLHQLQLSQDRLVLELNDRCNDNLLPELGL